MISAVTSENARRLVSRKRQVIYQSDTFYLILDICTEYLENNCYTKNSDLFALYCFTLISVSGDKCQITRVLTHRVQSTLRPNFLPVKFPHIY